MTIRSKMLGTVATVFLVMAAAVGIVYVEGGDALSKAMADAGLKSVVQSAEVFRGVLDRSSAVLAASAESLRYAYLNFGAVSQDEMARAAAALLVRNRQSGIEELFWGYESDGRFADGDGWKAPSGFDARVRP